MAQPAFDGDGKILFRQFLNALIRVANVVVREAQPPSLDQWTCGRGLHLPK